MIDRRLLVVTGKGGVGKTTTAAAIAASAASDGQRVLLCDTDCTGDVGTMLGRELAYAPTSIRPGLDAMEMRLDSAVVDYVTTQARMGFATRLGAVARTLSFVANSAPGVREVLSVGKLLNELRDDRYDLVVMDGPASGHVGGFLQTPFTINELTGSGIVGRQSAWMSEMLRDPDCTGVVVVATPEDFAVQEAAELLAALGGDTERGVEAIPIAGLVANRLRGRTLSGPVAAHLTTRLAVVEGAEYELLRNLSESVDRRRVELALVQQLFALAPGAVTCSVPSLPTVGADLVDDVAHLLGAEW